MSEHYLSHAKRARKKAFRNLPESQWAMELAGVGPRIFARIALTIQYVERYLAIVFRIPRRDDKPVIVDIDFID